MVSKISENDGYIIIILISFVGASILASSAYGSTESIMIAILVFILGLWILAIITCLIVIKILDYFSYESKCIKRANILFENKEYKKAMKIADLVLEKNPNYADAWHIKGRIYADENQHKKAVDCFKKAHKINPIETILKDPLWIYSKKALSAENRAKRKLEKREKDEKRELELIKKEKELLSSEYYYFIENFARKYRGTDFNVYSNNSTKLMKLLSSKGIELKEHHLIKIIEKEMEKQNYVDFRNKIIHNNPQNQRECIINLIEIYGENYENYLPFLRQLLDEKSFPASDKKIFSIIQEIKEESELKSFEKQLQNPHKVTNLDDIDNFSGYEFEKFLKQLYEKMGFNVINTPLSGDQGADLIIERFGQRSAVQAKCYNDKVSNKAVQEVVASIAHYQADSGIVVTNNEFTNSAIELANTNDIKLVNRAKLEKLINKYPIHKSSL